MLQYSTRRYAHPGCILRAGNGPAAGRVEAFFGDLHAWQLREWPVLLTRQAGQRAYSAFIAAYEKKVGPWKLTRTLAKEKA